MELSFAGAFEVDLVSVPKSLPEPPVAILLAPNLPGGGGGAVYELTAFDRDLLVKFQTTTVRGLGSRTSKIAFRNHALRLAWMVSHFPPVLHITTPKN
jgi:hypothetical protein